MEEKDKQKIKKDIEISFIERTRSTISEKITYCINNGLSEDEAFYTVIQAVKNLPNVLLPLQSRTSFQDKEWS